jgi:osmoprotectant transport system substrate-binding protein
VIRKHTRRAAKAAFAVSLAVAIVIGLLAAAFARPAHAQKSMGPTIILGTKNFGEEFILGQLYKQALEAKGFHVSYKENIGATEIVHAVYHHASSPSTASATYKLAKQLEAAHDISALTPTPFFDTDALAVTNASAKKYGLKSVGDLKKAGAFKLGGPPTCKTRTTCFLGYTKRYGITKATFVPLGIGLSYTALDKGQVLAADVFSTDPPLAKPSKYTLLADPKHVTGFQNVTPLVKTSVATALGSKFTSTVNAVSAKLTLPAITAMNKAFYVDKQSAKSIAKQFLKANGLL